MKSVDGKEVDIIDILSDIVSFKTLAIVLPTINIYYKKSNDW